MSSSQIIELFKSTLSRWNGWLNRWWKFSSPDRHSSHHLNTLRITPVSFPSPFSPRLNDQSIKETRLKIARILNWAESEVLISLALLSRFKFGALPRTYDLPSRHDLPTAFLNRPSIQLNIHTTENCANTELGWGWDFMLFPSHCSADSSSELFHEYTISLQPFLISRASNWTYTRLRIARILNWAEGEVLSRTTQSI